MDQDSPIDAWGCCTQSRQVFVFYDTNKLMIENSSKVKIRKIYFPRRESKGCSLS
jgi:hypothetical protein